MAPNFDPNPDDSVKLFGQKHVVQPHPQAPRLPFSQRAGRAVVHQVRDEKGEYSALKVFKKKYRDPSLIDATQVLGGIENFEGLRAAKRRVVVPSEPAARTYGNLEYAMLMSWVSGKTWFDILGQAQNEGYRLHQPVAIRLCDCFLEVMERLEAAGVAHTDISPGNVMVDLEANDVQLLDLEDMYMPGAPTPSQPSLGSAGYRHRSGDEGGTFWRPEGDRYAAAVLAAEMLVLANPKLARKATQEGFFVDHCEQPEGVARFNEARVWLEDFAPKFAPVFARSWSASSLEECPEIFELRVPIKRLAKAIPDNGTPITTSTPQIPRQGPWGEFKQTNWIGSSPSGRTSSKPPRQSPPVTGTGRPVVRWANEQEGKEVDETGGPSVVKVLLGVVAAAVVLFMLLLVAVAAAVA